METAVAVCQKLADTFIFDVLSKRKQVWIDCYSMHFVCLQQCRVVHWMIIQKCGVGMIFLYVSMKSLMRIWLKTCKNG